MGAEWIGLLGVVVGAVLQAGFEYLRHQRSTKHQRELDSKRIDLLRQSLENLPAGTEWRKLSTMCGIIGADPQTTTRLLIELGARGSEGEEEVWALLKNKPINH